MRQISKLVLIVSVLVHAGPVYDVNGNPVGGRCGDSTFWDPNLGLCRSCEPVCETADSEDCRGLCPHYTPAATTTAASTIPRPTETTTVNPDVHDGWPSSVALVVALCVLALATISGAVILGVVLWKKLRHSDHRSAPQGRSELRLDKRGADETLVRGELGTNLLCCDLDDSQNSGHLV